MRLRYKILLVILFLCSLIWIFTNLHLPGNSLFWNALQNSGHSIAFIIASIVVLKTVPTNIKRAIPVYLITLCSLFILGVVIELVQHYSGRDGSTHDLFMNAIGITVGTCIVILFKNIYKDNFIFRSALTLIIIGAVVFISYKPTVYLVGRILAPPLPILMNFDYAGASARVISINSDINIRVHKEAWPDNKTNSAKVSFKRGRWPSIKFLEPAKNWQSYKWLRFHVANNNITPVNIVVRVDDWSIDHTENPFMSIRREIPAGSSIVEIPLSEFIEEAEEVHNREKASFNQIVGFQIHISNNRKVQTLYFDDFALR